MNYNALYHWYASNKRDLPWRDTTNPYWIWLSEVILQQTRVSQGMEYYLRFIHEFPTVTDLAQASEDNVLRLWQGLGYYSRARNMHRAAQAIATYNSEHNTPDAFPTSYEQIRMLPGVGDYTAGAIAAFAYNLPYPALDGNVYRVLARFMDCDTPFDSTEGKRLFRTYAEALLDRENPRLFDSAIMELGALLCTPQQSDCDACPLREDCLARQHNTVQFLPVRKPRVKPTERTIQYLFYISPAHETLIHQRGTDDIWAHLWEFIPSTLHSQPSTLIHTPYTFTHILSHRKIHADFYVIPVDELPSIQDTQVVNIRNLDQYAFSRLTLRFLEAIQSTLL